MEQADPICFSPPLHVHDHVLLISLFIQSLELRTLQPEVNFSRGAVGANVNRERQAVRSEGVAVWKHGAPVDVSPRSGGGISSTSGGIVNDDDEEKAIGRTM